MEPKAKEESNQLTILQQMEEHSTVQQNDKYRLISFLGREFM